MQTKLLLLIVISSFILSFCGETAVKDTNLDKPFYAITLQDKIYDTQDRQFITYEEMIKKLTENQLVFIGETHNNVYAHKYELKIFQSLFKKSKKKIALGLEMFERDVQTVLDQYISNNISEKEFKSKSRPWSNYESDYKPLIEYARLNKVKVLALNAPRRIAAMVARHGKQTLSTLSISEQLHIAKDIDYSDKEYEKYFYSMLPQGHHKGHSDKMKQFLDASALKDDTMAESIVKHLSKKENEEDIVLVVNGKFHSDYGIAIPKRVKKRMDVPTALISIIPIPDSSTIQLNDYIGDGKIADYIIFTEDEKSYL